ncbi:MAG: arylsulfatase, partial [Planctomycetota bacterium]
RLVTAGFTMSSIHRPPPPRSYQHVRPRSHILNVLIALLCGSISAADTPRPNVVLILADDLGYGDLGCFGQTKLKTPRLDAMAQGGMKFTQFYAGCTVCAPSRSVLLTGKHMGRTTVRGNSTKPVVIRPGEPTLASALKSAGYRTACIGKWGIGTPDNLTNPNDVGFDHFFGYVNMWHAHNFYPEFLIRNGKVERLKNEVAPKWKNFQDPKQPMSGRGVAVKRVEYAPDLFIEDALRFLREEHKNPFFLYFAMNVPHANNEAGKKGMEVPDLYEFRGKDWPEPEKGFAAMIRNIDRDTGRIIDLLKELGIAKNTLVIFTSDNGPHREGGHSPDFFDSNGELRGIKRDLTEGGIRVPTIAYWPGTIQAGSVDNAHWYFGDFMSTLCELGGATAPKEIDSDSFLAALKGTPREKRWKRTSQMYWEFHERGSAQAIRFGKWKAIRRPMFTGPIELYDMSNDPGEKRDYAKRRPDLVNHAKNLLDKAHTPDPNWKLRKKR